MKKVAPKPVETTRNACKLCTPLGACLVFRGIDGAMPFLHGSQGCATYIRRYTISHFREPMDIASSSFSESDAVFGGGGNLAQGLDNVIRQYHPTLIGIATTCLAETIGEDLAGLLRGYRAERKGAMELPELVHVSTASYRGTHIDGFHHAVRTVVGTLAAGGTRDPRRVNLFPGLVSPADLRLLRETVEAFGLIPAILPDYSDTLDGPAWDSYHSLPQGGTSVEEIRATGRAATSVQFGHILNQDENSAADFLQKEFAVPVCKLGLPIGIRATDAFLEQLAQLATTPIPARLTQERGRLVDAYVDGHKYLFGRRAIVFGDDDLVIALTRFLLETGVVPVLCAAGGRSPSFAATLRAAAPELPAESLVRDATDFETLAECAAELATDLLIGNSKGQKLARELRIPLIRVGFPIHDRFGGQRLLHLGYRGAQELYDRVINAILEQKQESTDIGYGYL